MFWGPLRQINKTTTCVKLQKYLQTEWGRDPHSPRFQLSDLSSNDGVFYYSPVENIGSEDEILIDSK